MRLKMRIRFQRSQALREQIDDQFGIAKNLNHLGKIREKQGKPEEAQALYQQSLAILPELGAPEVKLALLNLYGLEGGKST
jgi:hypothetical protein